MLVRTGDLRGLAVTDEKPSENGGRMSWRKSALGPLPEGSVRRAP